MERSLRLIQLGQVEDTSVNLLVKLVFLWMYPYLVQEVSKHLVETPSRTLLCCNQVMVYSDSVVILKLVLLPELPEQDLFQVLMVLQSPLPLIQKKKIYCSLLLERQHSPLIPTGLVVVFYSLYKLQLRKLYMTMLDLEESSDLIILKRRKYTIITAVLSFLSQRTTMDLLSTQEQLHVLMLTVLFLRVKQQRLDASRYSIR